MNDRHNSDHRDALEKVMRAYHSQSVPDGPPDEFVTEVLAALHHAEEAANQPSTINLKQRILAMKLTTKIAIAATFLIAFSGLLAWLAPGGGTALAFDNLAEAFAKIRTATCKTSSEFEGPDGAPALSGKSMYLAPFRERVETSQPGGSMAITILDSQKARAILLAPEMKVATVFEAENMPADMPGNSFEQLRKLIADAQSGQGDKVEQVGRRMIDGRQAIGFRIPKADRETTIWADPDTGLPVRVESISYRTKSLTVMSDFRINVKLDESLFSLEVPEGYTVNRVKIDLSETTAEDLAQTLRVVAECNDGTFPAELQGVEGIMGVVIKTVNAKHGKDDSPEKLKAIGEFSAKVGRGFNFVRNLASDSDYHYAGKDVKLNTPDRPIFWYKPTQSKKYRVIYADLSIQDVAPADLPKER